MAFRFRRSISIFPGLRVNLTKRGASSISIGRRGAHMTFSDKGTRTSVGLPGSGLNYSEFTPANGIDRAPLERPGDTASPLRVALVLILIAAGLVTLFALTK
jgi:Protein of unknown function (DUF4236)